jgi:hypothetical protein
MTPPGSKKGRTSTPAKRSSNNVTPAKRSNSNITPAKRSNTSSATPVFARARPQSSASAALEALARKKANAVQASIGFGSVNKYKVGMKILLPDSIYPTKQAVSFRLN